MCSKSVDQKWSTFDLLHNVITFNMSIYMSTLILVTNKFVAHLFFLYTVCIYILHAFYKEKWN